MADTTPTAEERVVTWEDSRTTTDLIRAQAGMLSMLPLEELDAFLQRADGVGAIFDPTGFRKHGRGITAARRIVSATRKWIAEIESALQDAAR